MRVNLCVCAFAKTKQWDALALLVSRIRNRMFGWIFANVNVYFGSRVMRAMFRRPMSANNNSSSTDYGTKRKKLTTKKYVFVSEIDTRGWLHHRMFRTLSERVFAWVAIYERASNQFHVYLSLCDCSVPASLCEYACVLVTTKHDLLAEKNWNQFRCQRRHLLSFEFELSFNIFFIISVFSKFSFVGSDASIAWHCAASRIRYSVVKFIAYESESFLTFDKRFVL